MPKYSDFRAAIFDVDDTLLSNKPNGRGIGLHEQSRLAAVHQIGERYNIAALRELSADANYAAFRDAPVHSLEGAVWSILVMAGLVDGATINHEDKLLREIVALKDKLHEDILRTEGAEVPGAAHMVRALAAHGFAEHLAIASTAVRRDALISLDVVGVRSLFPDNQIITKEQFTHPKPHPESFQLALQSLQMDPGVTPSQVLAFEDDPRGVMSAKTAGLYTCAITTRYTKQQLAGQPVAPDLIADSFAEFEQLLGFA